jgi:glycosyltransferase involved in cell wall biosynthesis
MKILILTNKIPYPPRDGGSIATLNMIRGLHNAGNEITCLALNTNKHAFPVKEIPRELADAIRFIGVDCDSSIRPFHLLGNLLFSKEPYIAKRFDIKEFRSVLSSLLEQESFDIIQLEGPYPGLYLDLIRKKSSARIALRAHNVEHLIWERKAINELSIFRRSYLNNMAKRLKGFELELARSADILVPISEQDASYFMEKGSEKPMIIIQAAFQIGDYPLAELPEGNSIFFIGALDWLPNQEGLSWFLQHVFDRLLAELPELKFHVAGRNAPKRFERKLRHPNIVYHGEVEDAIDFMQSYRIMVAPLLSGSGIRIKILESMALGRPVITTSAGIEGIPAINYQHVVVEDDPGLFCAKLINLIRDAEKAERMRIEAREFIGRYFDTFDLSTRLSQFYNTAE